MQFFTVYSLQAKSKCYVKKYPRQAVKTKPLMILACKSDKRITKMRRL